MPIQRQGLSARQCWWVWNQLAPRAREAGLYIEDSPISRWHLPRAEANRRLAQLNARMQERGISIDLDTPVPRFPPLPEGYGQPRQPRRVRQVVGGSWGPDVLTTVLGIDQTFGCEFEVLMPQGMHSSTLIRKLRDVGLNAQDEFYNHAVRDYWKLTTDGSLGNYSRGRELVSPILSGSAGLEEVRKAAQVLLDAGCRVTKRCGFHVHVGAGHWHVNAFQRAWQVYAGFEAALDGVLAPSRRGNGNTYCRSLGGSIPMRMLSAMTVNELSHDRQGRSHDAHFNRYRKLNVQSFFRHRTIEFRQHQGTVQPDHAVMWVRFCLRFAARAERGDYQTPLGDDRSLEALLNLVECDADERTFLLGRREFFARQDARRQARTGPHISPLFGTQMAA
jgi:hypothetical protein